MRTFGNILRTFRYFLVPEVDFFVASAVFLAALVDSFAAFAVSSVAVVKCFTAEAALCADSAASVAAPAKADAACSFSSC